MNDGPELVLRTLNALADQENVNWRLIHIDSGSTDGTLDILHEFGGEILHIRPSEYIPGRVLNFGMELCDDEYVTFLNADATPVGRHWLHRLIEPLTQNIDIVATFSRQIPREDASPLVRLDYNRAFGDGSIHRQWKHFFSMASSAVQRTWWRDNQFNNGIRYSEDIEWTYRARKAGREILYVPESTVVHSHNYELKQAYKRHFGEGAADQKIYSLGSYQSSFLRQAVIPLLSDSIRDAQHGIASHNISLFKEFPLVRAMQKLGHWRGMAAGRATSSSYSDFKEPDVAFPTRGRYTVDPHPEFEALLDSHFKIITDRLQNINASPMAIVLGGGYGRGEGGIYQFGRRSLPYNDYDLYAVFDSGRLGPGKQIIAEIHEASEELSRNCGLDVDIAPVSIEKLRRCEPRIEWYELRRGHRVLSGPVRLLDQMPEMWGRELPWDEGERLLMNRATGMILAKQRLEPFMDSKEPLPDRDVDFITRNIFKALLAAGDVILLRLGLYHYSYRERSRRFAALHLVDPVPFLRLQANYEAAHHFRTKPEFLRRRYCELSGFWEESRILLEIAHKWFILSTRDAASWTEYAESLGSKTSISAKTLLHIGKNVRFSGHTPKSTSSWNIYFNHPQFRTRVAAPILLNSCIAGDNNQNPQAEELKLLSRMLEMPAPDSENKETMTSWMSAAQAKFISLWQETN